MNRARRVIEIYTQAEMFSLILLFFLEQCTYCMKSVSIKWVKLASAIGPHRKVVCQCLVRVIREINKLILGGYILFDYEL